MSRKKGKTPVLLRLINDNKEKKKRGTNRQHKQQVTVAQTSDRFPLINPLLTHFCCETAITLQPGTPNNTQEDTQEHAAADSTTATHRRD